MSSKVSAEDGFSPNQNPLNQLKNWNRKQILFIWLESIYVLESEPISLFVMELES